MRKKLSWAAILFIFFVTPARAQEVKGFRIELYNKASEGRAIVLIKNNRAVSLMPGDNWWYEAGDAKKSSFGQDPPCDLKFMMCAKVKFRFAYPPAWAMDPKVVGKYAITDAYFQQVPMTFELVGRRANILKYLKSRGRSERDLALMAHELHDWVLKNHALDLDCIDPVELETTLDWRSVSKHRISVTGNRKEGYAITVE